MYAITVVLDIKALEQHYPTASWRNAYQDIERFLEEFGFARQQGSVYFGDDEVDAVTCVTAVQKLAQQYTWLDKCVTDIRMLRIEEFNDLMPAIKS